MSSGVRGEEGVISNRCDRLGKCGEQRGREEVEEAEQVEKGCIWTEGITGMAYFVLYWVEL